MKWTEFIKYSSVLMKIAMLLEFVDIVTDYMYSTSLIRQSTMYYNQYSQTQDASLAKYNSIKTMAWISLICGVIGSLLFVCELMLARKLYSKIPVLREKLRKYSKLQSDDIIPNPTFITHYDIIHEIRIRKVDIDVFAILVACFEDIPQITIVIVVTSILSEWTQFSILSLMLSISSCTMKFLKVMVDLFGCGDDAIDVFGYQDINMSDAASTTVSISTTSSGDMTRKLKHRGSMVNVTGVDDNTDDITDYTDSDDTRERHRVSLVDSDESSDDDDQEEDDESSDSEDGEHSLINDTNKNNKGKKKKSKGRTLRISRRATWKRHKLLMIPEETDENEEWSEFEHDF